jgi:predicted Fe-Mo cluster-binding NifX family protein
MKILFSSNGKTWDDLLDERFGRAAGFVLYDQEEDTLSYHSNEENLKASHGAGTQAAQFSINSGASIIITGHVGPKAFDVLKLSGIHVFLSTEKSLKEVYEAYKQGKLEQQFQ